MKCEKCETTMEVISEITETQFGISRVEWCNKCGTLLHQYLSRMYPIKNSMYWYYTANKKEDK